VEDFGGHAIANDSYVVLFVCHPNVIHHTTLEPILADPSISLIIVTSSPDAHFSQAKACLEAGKHVLVEKPFVPTSAQADELIAIAKKHDKLLCVYQNRRWDTDFLTLQKLIKDDILGRVLEFETHYDRYRPETPVTWKGTLNMSKGGGVLFDLGAHLLDQAVVAFGIPKTVTGFFSNERDTTGKTEEPDSFTAVLQYGQGKPFVTVKSGVRTIATPQLRFWVRGTKGSYRKSYIDIQEDQLKAGMLPTHKGFGIESEERWGTLTTAKGQDMVETKQENVQPETYHALYKGFVDAIEKGNEKLVPVKASEARDVLKVIEAVIKSASEGKSVVM